MTGTFRFVTMRPSGLVHLALISAATAMDGVAR
jgi:hypothetical protein